MTRRDRAITHHSAEMRTRAETVLTADTGAPIAHTPQPSAEEIWQRAQRAHETALIARLRARGAKR